MPKPAHCDIQHGCDLPVCARLAAIGLDGQVQDRVHTCRRHLSDAVTRRWGHPTEWRTFAVAIIPANMEIVLDNDGREVTL